MLNKKTKEDYNTLIKQIFPFIKTNKELIVLTQVISALAINQQLDPNQLTKENADLIKKIQASILNTPEKLQEALAISKKLQA